MNELDVAKKQKIESESIKVLERNSVIFSKQKKTINCARQYGIKINGAIDGLVNYCGWTREK